LAANASIGREPVILKRGAITILFRVSIERKAARMRSAAEEISDIGFFNRLPAKATPSAKFFWKSQRSRQFDKPGRLR
jgi:hypothetical protein